MIKLSGNGSGAGIDVFQSPTFLFPGANTSATVNHNRNRTPTTAQVWGNDGGGWATNPCHYLGYNGVGAGIQVTFPNDNQCTMFFHQNVWGINTGSPGLYLLLTFA